MSKQDTTKDDIARLIQVASDNLRISYNLDSIFDEIRKEFFINAKLYNDKITPFSQITIENIGEFCDKITSFDSFEIMQLIKDGKSIEKLCQYTTLFHKEIIVEFKKIEDKFTSSILEQNLNKTKLDEEPLRKSISQYCTFLSGIYELFSTIYGYLRLLMENINQTNDYRNNATDYFQSMNNYLVRYIKQYCSNYLKMYRDHQLDLYSIDDKSNKIYINERIDEWIKKVINKKNKSKEFQDLLTEKNDSRLNNICGLLK